MLVRLESFHSSAVRLPPFLNALGFCWGGKWVTGLFHYPLFSVHSRLGLGAWLFSRSTCFFGKKTCRWCCVLGVESKIDPQTEVSSAKFIHYKVPDSSVLSLPHALLVAAWLHEGDGFLTPSPSTSTPHLQLLCEELSFSAVGVGRAGPFPSP